MSNVISQKRKFQSKVKKYGHNLLCDKDYSSSNLFLWSKVNISGYFHLFFLTSYNRLTLITNNSADRYPDFYVKNNYI